MPTTNSGSKPKARPQSFALRLYVTQSIQVFITIITHPHRILVPKLQHRHFLGRAVSAEYTTAIGPERTQNNVEFRERWSAAKVYKDNDLPEATMMTPLDHSKRASALGAHLYVGVFDEMLVVMQGPNHYRTSGVTCPQPVSDHRTMDNA